MKLKDIGIMLTPTFRAFAYLQKLVKNGMYPGYALILGSKDCNYFQKVSEQNKLNFFERFEDFKATLNKYKIGFEEVDAVDCNDENVIEVIKKRQENYFIFTGGGILKEGILGLDKKFIHVHSGILPNYRGSTCIYYSIIKEDNCGATAFFMSKSIDAGSIIAKKTFKKPSIPDIDYEYDSYIRSEVLVQIMKDYGANGKFTSIPQSPDEGEMYFIIHPILKHLAILSCINQNRNI